MFFFRDEEIVEDANGPFVIDKIVDELLLKTTNLSAQHPNPDYDVNVNLQNSNTSNEYLLGRSDYANNNTLPNSGKTSKNSVTFLTI